MSTKAERSAAAKKGARTRARNAAKRISNPASACSPMRRPTSKSRGSNTHEGQYIVYRGTRLRVMGCGVGKTARRSIGMQEEGTYALLNEKTNRVIYVAKRVVRDILYRRGREGAPRARGPRTAAKRKSARAKMTPAEKLAWKRKMDRAKAAKARR